MTCWECPIGVDTCPPVSRCPLPYHEHAWVDVTQLQDEWRHEMCSECHGERIAPRAEWLIA